MAIHAAFAAASDVACILIKDEAESETKVCATGEVIQASTTEKVERAASATMVGCVDGMMVGCITKVEESVDLLFCFEPTREPELRSSSKIFSDEIAGRSDEVSSLHEVIGVVVFLIRRSLPHSLRT